MSRYFPEVPSLVSQAIEETGIAEKIAEVIDTWFNNSRYAKVIEREGISVPAIEVDGSEHKLVAFKRDGLIVVCVWPLSTYTPEDLDSRLSYEIYDEAVAFALVEKDTTFKEGLASKKHSSLYHKVEQKIDKVFGTFRVNNKIVKYMKPFDENALAYAKNECVYAADQISPLYKTLRVVTDNGFLLGGKSAEDTIRISMTMCSMIPRIQADNFLDAKTFYKQLNYVYERGLELKEKFYYNDSDYKVWKPDASKNVVCLMDQDICFVITKQDDGLIKVDTTADYNAQGKLIERNLENNAFDMFMHEEKYSDLSLMIRPDSFGMVGGYLYSLAIDVVGAVDALEEETKIVCDDGEHEGFEEDELDM